MDDVLAGVVFLVLFCAAVFGAAALGAWFGWACFALMGVGAIAYIAAP